MLRHVIAAFALATTTLAATGTSGQAPADEYFGPFKYSAISVRTKIGALGRAYDQRWQDDDSIVHDAGLVESSLRVWAQQYPNDSWLAPTFLHLAQLYQKVQTPVARNHARAMYQLLAQTFPKSKEAHLARLRLQQGFPALHSESPVSPTPNPYVSAAPATSVPPGAEPSSAPSAEPNVTPAPAASTMPSAAAKASSAPSPQPTSSAKP